MQVQSNMEFKIEYDQKNTQKRIYSERLPIWTNFITFMETGQLYTETV